MKSAVVANVYSCIDLNFSSKICVKIKKKKRLILIVEKSTTSTETTSSKGKSWKRWGGILGKGKSNTLQKSRNKNENNASREQPYRWSTGLRWLPIIPTASKETLVRRH